MLAAMALGRAIRRLDMTTPSAGPSRSRAPATRDRRAIASQGQLPIDVRLHAARRHAPLRAGGGARHGPSDLARKKAKRALEASYSAEELGRVQRDIGSLARYTVEMGGGIELLETALRVPPWEPMYRLTADEVRRMRLTTLDHLFADEVPTASISKSQPPILTAVHAGGE